MSDQNNYYILLGLDPHMRDWASLERVLAEKTAQWKKAYKGNSANDKANAQRWLKELPQIQKVLGDTAVRNRMAEEAVKQNQARREAEHQARLDRLERLVDLLRGKRTTAKQVKELVQQTGLDEEMVRKVLKAKGIPVESKTRRPSRAYLDPSEAKEITRALELLGHPSLYAFLGLPDTAQSSRLVAVAQERYDRIISENQRGVHVEASQKLAGKAMAIFAEDSKRARYDNSLVLHILSQLDPDLDLAGSDGTINHHALGQLLKRAAELGVGEARAREHIEEYAEERGWRLTPAVESDNHLPRCGACKTPARETAQERCGGCGEALRRQCPGCRQLCWTEDTCCPQCGYNLAQAAEVEQALRAGQRALTLENWSLARQWFRKALSLWPDCQAAQKGQSEVERAEQHAAHRQRDREKKLSEVSRLIAARKLVQAAGLLDLLQSGGDRHIAEELQRHVRDGLKRARVAYDLGQQLAQQGQAEQAVGKFQEALQYAADFTEASYAIQKHPPRPPRVLKRSGFGRRVKLHWQPPNVSGEFEFWVVRKQGVRPEAPSDGTQLAALPSSVRAYDEEIPWSKVIHYHYAVFTVRHGTASRPASVRPLSLHDREIPSSAKLAAVCTAVGLLSLVVLQFSLSTSPEIANPRQVSVPVPDPSPVETPTAVLPPNASRAPSLPMEANQPEPKGESSAPASEITPPPSALEPRQQTKPSERGPLKAPPASNTTGVPPLIRSAPESPAHCERRCFERCGPDAGCIARCRC